MEGVQAERDGRTENARPGRDPAVLAVLVSVLAGPGRAWAADGGGQDTWANAQASGGELTVQAGVTRWTPPTGSSWAKQAGSDPPPGKPDPNQPYGCTYAAGGPSATASIGAGGPQPGQWVFPVCAGPGVIDPMPPVWVTGAQPAAGAGHHRRRIQREHRGHEPRRWTPPLRAQPTDSLLEYNDIIELSLCYQVRKRRRRQMATQDATAAPGLPSQPVTERVARYLPGLRMLVLGIVLLLAGAALAVLTGHLHHGAATAVLVLCVLVFIAAVFVLRGLTSVTPGHARVVQLFGRYRGTIRDSGLQWVNPFTERIVVSTRIRNQESAQAKVNDADGNPIEIAAVVVWQVADTASAVYSVDDFTEFVTIQTETAVRHIASSYPYDSRGTGKLSLRDNADEITERLSAELTDRVRPAGVQIIESRLTRLSYAAEIAQAMLRQQQANAIVGARQRIVEGAVGMVKLALERLQEEGVVELDEERKAAMVSNLLVVLCSEQATQQVVNTGSLYQ